MIGSLLASGQTAAAEGTVGALRHDPMAMLPFLGYNAGEYLQHWIDMGKKGGDLMPSIFLVNWFRKNDEGKIIWPGFGENSRVLKWITERVDGKVGAEKTIVGNTARAEDLDLTGLETSLDEVKEVLAVDPAEWASDVDDNAEYLNFLGSRVPDEVLEQFEALKSRIEEASTTK